MPFCIPTRLTSAAISTLCLLTQITLECSSTTLIARSLLKRTPLRYSICLYSSKTPCWQCINRSSTHSMLTPVSRSLSRSFSREFESLSLKIRIKESLFRNLAFGPSDLQPERSSSQALFAHLVVLWLQGRFKWWRARPCSSRTRTLATKRGLPRSDRDQQVTMVALPSKRYEPGGSALLV